MCGLLLQDGTRRTPVHSRRINRFRFDFYRCLYRMHTELGVTLRYPSYLEGLPASADES